MSREKTKRLTQLSLLFAILMIQTFVPGIGYIPIGPLQATIIHITVIVGAILFGQRTGWILGATWGILRMVKAMLMPDILSIVFLNPLVSVLPRMLVGGLSAWLFLRLVEKMDHKYAYVMTGIFGSLVNTVFVLSAIYLFAAESYADALGMPTTALMGTFIATAGTNGLLEAAVSGILTPILVTPLARALRRTNKMA